MPERQAKAFGAAPPRVARTLDVEVVETPRGAAPRTHHELLAVTDDTGWASVQSHGPTELSLRARSSVDPRGAVLVEVDLHRTNRTDGDVDVATALPWSAGHRSPLSRIERDDGSIVELFVTTR